MVGRLDLSIAEAGQGAETQAPGATRRLLCELPACVWQIESQAFLMPIPVAEHRALGPHQPGPGCGPALRSLLLDPTDGGLPPKAWKRVVGLWDQVDARLSPRMGQAR